MVGEVVAASELLDDGRDCGRPVGFQGCRIGDCVAVPACPKCAEGVGRACDGERHGLCSFRRERVGRLARCGGRTELGEGVVERVEAPVCGSVVVDVGAQPDADDRDVVDAVAGPDRSSGVSGDVVESGGEVLADAVLCGELAAACPGGHTGMADRLVGGRGGDGIDGCSEHGCGDGGLTKVDEREVVSAAGGVVVERYDAAAVTTDDVDDVAAGVCDTVSGSDTVGVGMRGEGEREGARFAPAAVM